MRKALISALVPFLIDSILTQLDEEAAKSLIDDGLDALEDRFTGNTSVLKVIAHLRKVISVPDDFGGDSD